MSKKLMRAPIRQRLLVTKDSTSKAMVTPRLDLAQCRDTKHAAGMRTPGPGRQTVTREPPRAPTPAPGHPPAPVAVSSFLMAMSLRTFRETRKSARRPPSTVLVKEATSSRADRNPL